jgi:hypothetical protein
MKMYREISDIILLPGLFPPLLISLDALIYFLIFPSHFDPTMTTMLATYKAQGLDATTPMLTGILII